MGRLPTAEAPPREASPSPRGRFGALPGPPHEGHRAVGEDAFAQRLGVPRSGARSRPVSARARW
eukprot:13109719-Alexandrium_andersonii.AAC.1